MAIERSVRIGGMAPAGSTGRPHGSAEMGDPAAPGAGGLTPDSLAWAAERVGDRWMLLIVNALLSGPLRFGELAEALPGIATNVLSQRLKRLESDRLLVSSAYSARPPRFSYELTQTGRGLGGVVPPLAQGGGGAGGGEGGPHSSRGTAPRAG